MQFNKIIIIGLGLIGGSLALALKKSGQVKHVVGVDVLPESVEIALRKGIIDEGQVGIDEVVYDSDIVVIATHVGSIVDIARAISVSDSTVVTDTGSVKENIVNEIENSCNLRFIGSHPIAGTEKSGVSNVVDGLFKDKITIITPTNNSTSEATETVTRMWTVIQSKVIRLSAQKHDEIFAHVSHLPHVCAFSLVNSLIKKDSTLFNYGGGGLKDFSRIAESSPDMWVDIFIYNKDEILKAIDEYKDSLSEIENYIKKSDKKSLKNILGSSSNIKK
ncbi:MAG TPA: prephenate dehydrogenase/arogenate dehydrogenase family protein [Thermodesulfobacteriota bacterium]|nr:prephenate dehydrogenase/arogenate dehydrogenase family protein [Thermodesulfobacteriota bacterium]